MIKNALPDKSGNPENHKKIISTVRKLLYNVSIVGKDLVRVF